MPSEQPNIFEVAKQVSEQLGSIPKEDQVKVLRWVSESLGLPTGDLGRSSRAAPALQTDTGAPAGVSNSARPAGHRTDIRSFLTEKQPKSDNQYATAVAYYYRFEAPEPEQADSISAETLQEAARLAGRARLGDPSATLRNAVAQGYLDRVDRGQYRISTVGENLVAMTLPGGADSPAPTRKKRSSKKTASKKKTGKKKK